MNSFHSSITTPYILIVSNDAEYLEAAAKTIGLHLPGFAVFKASDPFVAINIMHALDRSVIFIIEYDMLDMDGYRFVTDVVRKTFRFDSFCLMILDQEKWDIVDKCSREGIPCRPKSLIGMDPSKGKVYNLENFFLGDLLYAARELRKLQLDPLTQFYTRQAGEARLTRDLNRSRGDNGGHGAEVSAIFADLNYLKRTNDTYGHQAGDMLIKAFATIVHACIRERRSERDGFDYAIRWGRGDEFLIVLYGAGQATVRRVIARIQEQLQDVRVEVAPDTFVKVVVAMGSETLSRRTIKNRRGKENELIEILAHNSDQDMYRNKGELKLLHRAAVRNFMVNSWVSTQLRLTYDPHV